MTTLRKAAQQALNALSCIEYGMCGITDGPSDDTTEAAMDALRAALAEPVEEPISVRAVAKQAGINLPETYIPTMDDAIAAGDSVLMDEQAALLRECRAALDSLIEQKPTLAGLVCGSTTLGNLKAELGAYRPQGVFGSRPQAREQEPVAYRFQSPATEEWLLGLEPPAGSRWEIEPLYATPPQRKPLTDEEIYGMYSEPRSDAELVEFARAIERAHGIGGSDE